MQFEFVDDLAVGRSVVVYSIFLKLGKADQSQRTHPDSGLYSLQLLEQVNEVVEPLIVLVLLSAALT
jgi:hypothetical protein